MNLRDGTAEEAPVRLSLAPVHNCLNSLALLTDDSGQGEMRFPWVRRTRAAMTPDQQRVHQVLFGELAVALLPDQELHSMAAYLDQLAGQSPAAFQARALDLLCLQSRDRAPLSEEARSLLDDPARLHSTAITHLAAMWQEHMAHEWGRVEPILHTMLPAVARHLAAYISAIDAVHALGGHAETAYPWPDGGGKRVVLVLSPHMAGRARAGRNEPLQTRSALTETALWAFFGDRPHAALLRDTPVGRTELLTRLRALSDETCLQILSLLTQYDPTELTAQEIMTRLNLTQPTASRHLKLLSTAGFVAERRQGGPSKHYRLVHGHITHTFGAVERWLRNPEEEHQLESPSPVPELARFLDRDGRLTGWPARRRDQMLALAYLVSHFEPGHSYSEPEVNARLNRWHTWSDHAKLRRALYDERLLDRAPDGSRYWRTE